MKNSMVNIENMKLNWLTFFDNVKVIFSPRKIFDSVVESNYWPFDRSLIYYQSTTDSANENKQQKLGQLIELSREGYNICFMIDMFVLHKHPWMIRNR